VMIQSVNQARDVSAVCQGAAEMLRFLPEGVPWQKSNKFAEKAYYEEENREYNEENKSIGVIFIGVRMGG
jgi:hypothetical protein